MSVITRVPEPNIWDAICREFDFKNKGVEESDNASIQTDYEDFDPRKHNPVFYGKMHSTVVTDQDVMAEVDISKTHPSCIGYAFTEKPPASPPPPPTPPPPKESCTPRQYLEIYIFPILLPALEEMLKEAKKEKCFERKRTKFNALDFLTEYLYKNNNCHTDRENMQLLDIPFVSDWLKDHPRPPLPLSLIWTEEEAAQKVQAFWRGYMVRRDPEVQELRQWQREWKDENNGIQGRVNEFWEKQMPDGDKPTPNASEDQLNIDENKPLTVQSPSGK